MQKPLGFLIITMSMAGTAFGRAFKCRNFDASTGASAIALVSGGLMVLRGLAGR